LLRNTTTTDGCQNVTVKATVTNALISFDRDGGQSQNTNSIDINCNTLVQPVRYEG
jgi:hypothetical protein